MTLQCTKTRQQINIRATLESFHPHDTKITQKHLGGCTRVKAVSFIMSPFQVIFYPSSTHQQTMYVHTHLFLQFRTRPVDMKPSPVTHQATYDPDGFFNPFSHASCSNSRPTCVSALISSEKEPKNTPGSPWGLKRAPADRVT